MGLMRFIFCALKVQNSAFPSTKYKPHQLYQPNQPNQSTQISLVIANDVRPLLDERRYNHEDHCCCRANSGEQPEEARTMKLCEKSAAFDVVLDYRNQHVAQGNAQKEASHDG